MRVIYLRFGHGGLGLQSQLDMGGLLLRSTYMASSELGMSMDGHGMGMGMGRGLWCVVWFFASGHNLHFRARASPAEQLLYASGRGITFDCHGQAKRSIYHSRNVHLAHKHSSFCVFPCEGRYVIRVGTHLTLSITGIDDARSEMPLCSIHSTRYPSPSPPHPLLSW